MPKYYDINENAARRAKEANSWSNYVQGSATEEYRQMVDAAEEIAEMQKRRVGVEYHGKIDELLDVYARKLAANMNKRNEIDARVPSVMIAKEMEARKYKYDFERFAQYFPLGGYQEVSKEDLFKDWHTNRYLRQCFSNLQEKFDCGGVPVAQWAAVCYHLKGVDLA